MHSPTQIANFWIPRQLCTYARLSILTYLTYGYYLARTRKPLFRDRALMGVEYPVFADIVGCLEGHPIQAGIYKPLPEEAGLKPIENNPDLVAVLEKVAVQYSKLTEVELVEVVQAENSAFMTMVSVSGGTFQWGTPLTISLVERAFRFQ